MSHLVCSDSAFLLSYCVVFRKLVDFFHALRLLLVKLVDSIMCCHLLHGDSEISSSSASPSVTVS